MRWTCHASFPFSGDRFTCSNLAAGGLCGDWHRNIKEVGKAPPLAQKGVGPLVYNPLTLLLSPARLLGQVAGSASTKKRAFHQILPSGDVGDLARASRVLEYIISLTWYIMGQWKVPTSSHSMLKAGHSLLQKFVNFPGHTNSPRVSAWWLKSLKCDQTSFRRVELTVCPIIVFFKIAK